MSVLLFPKGQGVVRHGLDDRERLDADAGVLEQAAELLAHLVVEIDVDLVVQATLL